MKTDIEYAAMAMGFKHWAETGLATTQGLYILGGEDEWFCPLQDDGDSRRLENACFRWMMDGESVVPPDVWQHDSWLDDARRAGNADEYRAAVFALAVAIGKTMEGSDAQQA
jgi:hypothetical protein